MLNFLALAGASNPASGASWSRTSQSCRTAAGPSSPQGLLGYDSRNLRARLRAALRLRMRIHPGGGQLSGQQVGADQGQPVPPPDIGDERNAASPSCPTRPFDQRSLTTWATMKRSSTADGAVNPFVV